MPRLESPFTPVFGDRPHVFFGRRHVLGRFDSAMVNPGSPDRSLFITGTRGSGKTSLVGRLCARASRQGYRVFDLGPSDTVQRLLRSLARHDGLAATRGPMERAAAPGMGAGVGLLAKTARLGRHDLQPLLLRACRHARRGILVTVDDVHKVPAEDVSAICNACQMASRKGHDILLVLAGLPYAFEKTIYHEGCTFLRRASHEEIGLLTWKEADEALKEAFACVGTITDDQVTIDALNHESKGQPYLMQLLGFFLVGLLDEESSKIGRAHV